VPARLPTSARLPKSRLRCGFNLGTQQTQRSRDFGNLALVGSRAGTDAGSSYALSLLPHRFLLHERFHNRVRSPRPPVMSI
jgi:hypothetical protein